MTQITRNILNRCFFYVGVAFLIAPIVMVCTMAFYNFDESINRETWLSGFKEIITPLRFEELRKIIIRALIISCITTLMTFFISYLVVIYTSIRFRTFFLITLSLPFLVNESIRIFSWQYVLSENGMFNRMLSWLFQSDIIIFNGSNSWNIYFAMIISCVPFGIFINSGSIQVIPKIYWEMANDLNLNKFAKFLKIGVLMSKTSIIATFIIVFFVAFSLSAEVNFLGGDSKISIRNFILSLMSANKFQAIFALGFIIVLILCFIPLIYNIIKKTMR